MSEWGITGIQQIGVGVMDLDESFRWCRRVLGLDVPVFNDEGLAGLMIRYTGGVPRERKALLAANLQGGGGLEIWQFTSRVPQPAGFEVRLGDLGIFSVSIKTRNASTAFIELRKKGAEPVDAAASDPAGRSHFFIRGREGLFFEIVEAADWFAGGRHVTGGVCGCMIGVSDIGKAIPFYSGILGYDEVLSDACGRFGDLAALPGGDGELRRVLLAHRGKREGAFHRLLGVSRIELVQSLDRAPRRIYGDRFWGDPGFMHLCFDVWGMDALRRFCARMGFPFTVDSAEDFSMEGAAGRFAYVEDPDGTLIEFVETRRVALIAALGWFLDLGARDPRKPLPDILVKAMALKRVRG